MFFLIALSIAVGITALAGLVVWFINRKSYTITLGYGLTLSKYGISQWDWLPKFELTLLRSVAAPKIYNICISLFCFSVVLSILPSTKSITELSEIVRSTVSTAANTAKSVKTTAKPVVSVTTKKSTSKATSVKKK